MESARVATGDDLSELVTLARDAIDELRDTKGGALWARREARAEPLDESLGSALDDGDQLVLVGCIDEVIVGYAVLRLEPLRDGSLLGRLDDLYVRAEARGVAVGETMMDEVLEWARGRGCIGVDSLALPGNRATKNFFEGFGLVARAIIVHKPLLDG